jgi:DNA/RNA non-specific endonuclease
MLKKLILSIFLLVLTACSSTYVSKTDMIKKKEIIKLAITTPDKSIYLLGDNYDYQFTGEEARKLQTLIEFQKMKGLTKENLTQVKKRIRVSKDGNMTLSVSTEFTIYKKSKTDKDNKNFEKDQEDFINDFKKKLKEKDIDFTVKEDEEGWHFDLPNAIEVSGKTARLPNRNDILQKSSDKIINLELDLAVEYQLSDTEYKKRVSNERWRSAGEFVLGVIAAPFVIAWGVLTLPVWFYAVTH